MPKISEEVPYNGASGRISRLGLEVLVDEVRKIVTQFNLRVEEKKDANGGAAVRKLVDARFQESGGWTQTQVGDIDWLKCKTVNGARVCVGVEVQFSARSDLLIIDIIHLRKALTAGLIDLGILIVPSDKLSYFLTDRGPSISAAKRHISEARAEDLPLLLIAVDHDGPGPRLPKQKKRVVE